MNQNSRYSREVYKTSNLFSVDFYVYEENVFVHRIPLDFKAQKFHSVIQVERLIKTIAFSVIKNILMKISISFV